MLTAARAWVGPPQVGRRPGVVDGCDRHRHLLGEENGACRSIHHQKLAMTRVGLEGTVMSRPACKKGVEGDDAGLWIRYSRKRKKQERGSPEVGEEDGSGTRETGAKAGRGDQVGATMSSLSNIVCADCGTTRTPLWRKGPAGPKSLCNACGIRYRKVKRAGGPSLNAAVPTPPATVGDQREGDPHVSSVIPMSLKLTAAAEEEQKQGGDSQLLRRQRQRRREEVLWLLLEESRKFELPCGKEAVEAAVLLMAMSFGLFVRSH